MQARTVTIHENTVVKTGDPSHMLVEAEKTRRAFDIGERSGLFQVPRVLDYDATKGILTLDRLKNIHKIGSVLTSGYEEGLLVDKIATSLAVIHEELSLPRNMNIPLPKEVDFPGNKVFIHGDLSTNNVFTTPDRQNIVILDWQMTAMHGGEATYGTRYFDVIWFINNLFGLMCRLNQAYHHSKHAKPIATRFISTYLHANNSVEDYETIIAYMKLFFKFKLEQRKRDDWKSKLLRLLVGPCIKRFINNPKLAQEISGESNERKF